MATRSNIGVKTGEGKYKVIYCHWDGYPSHNGKLLLENYDTQEKVEELIGMGDVSSLRETVKEGDTIFYYRDKGEKWENVKHDEFDSLSKMLEHCDNDYTYLFCDGKWYYRNWNNNLQELTRIFAMKSKI